jgi:hypothetical protein
MQNSFALQRWRFFRTIIRCCCRCIVTPS